MRKPLVRGLPRYVYVAHWPATAEIKIGSSFFPGARIQEHTNQCGKRVNLLVQIRGSVQDEARYHRCLSAFRSRRYSKEWFRPTPEVLLTVSEMMFIERANKAAA